MGDFKIVPKQRLKQCWPGCAGMVIPSPKIRLHRLPFSRPCAKPRLQSRPHLDGPGRNVQIRRRAARRRGRDHVRVRHLAGSAGSMSRNGTQP